VPVSNATPAGLFVPLGKVTDLQRGLKQMKLLAT